LKEEADEKKRKAEEEAEANKENKEEVKAEWYLRTCTIGKFINSFHFDRLTY
jgi:hypothetical protein